MLIAKTGGSMFAHLLGRARAAEDGKKPGDKAKGEPKAEDEEDEDEDGSTEDKVDDLEDKVEDLEDKVDDLEEDADEDEEEKDKDAAKAARKAERARCAAIFAAPAAANNVALAAELAFGTNLSAKQAIGVLRAGGPAARGGGLGQRMEGAPTVRIGAGGTETPGLDTANGAAGSVLAAMKAARRERS